MKVKQDTVFKNKIKANKKDKWEKKRKKYTFLKYWKLPSLYPSELKNLFCNNAKNLVMLNLAVFTQYYDFYETDVETVEEYRKVMGTKGDIIDDLNVELII